MKSDLSILYRKHRTIFIIIQIEQLIKTPGRKTGLPPYKQFVHLPISSIYRKNKTVHTGVPDAPDSRHLEVSTGSLRF